MVTRHHESISGHRIKYLPCYLRLKCIKLLGLECLSRRNDKELVNPNGIVRVQVNTIHERNKLTKRYISYRILLLYTTCIGEQWANSINIL